MTVRNSRAFELGRLLDEDAAPGSVRAARERLHEAHVAPLTRLVEEVRAETGEKVPDVDPGCGGVGARVLLLRQDPFCSAEDGCRLVSPYADDATAGNLLRASEAAGLVDADVLHWNVVPWWVDDPDHRPPGRRTRSRPAEARRAEPYLRRLMALLPRLDTVVLLGRQAQQEWDAAVPAGTTAVRVLRCPAPSPMSFHARAADGRPNRDHVVEALAAAAGPPVDPPVHPPLAADV